MMRVRANRRRFFACWVSANACSELRDSRSGYPGGIEEGSQALKMPERRPLGRPLVGRRLVVQLVSSLRLPVAERRGTDSRWR
jgi:hypothetical protein